MSPATSPLHPGLAIWHRKTGDAYVPVLQGQIVQDSVMAPVPGMCPIGPTQKEGDVVGWSCFRGWFDSQGPHSICRDNEVGWAIDPGYVDAERYVAAARAGVVVVFFGYAYAACVPSSPPRMSTASWPSIRYLCSMWERKDGLWREILFDTPEGPASACVLNAQGGCRAVGPKNYTQYATIPYLWEIGDI